jgi:hypothetical protein
MLNPYDVKVGSEMLSSVCTLMDSSSFVCVLAGSIMCYVSDNTIFVV